MGNIKIWGSMQAIGLMSLLLVFYIEVLSAARLLLGYSVWGADCYIAFILSAVTCFMLLPDLKDVRHIIVIIIFFALFLFVCIYAYGQFYSADYDGNTYHKMAVGLLKNGWNPLQESAGDFAVRYFRDSRINSRAIWIDHYGKASWIFAANIYVITGNIECGKVYQILAMESLFCLAVPYLAQRGMKKWAAVLCGFILVLNPVSLVQVFSYYVDGFLFSYLFILILGLTQLVDSADTQSAYAWMIVFSSMAVLANIKFTGLLYGGIYCIAYYFLYIFYRWKDGRRIVSKENIRTGLVFACLGAMSVIWIGFPTYIKNYLDHGTFTYPLTGSGIDIITENSPRGFQGKGSIYKLFYGIFGRLSNVSFKAKEALPALKIPFSVSKSEFAFLGIDMRISGLGFFFSGILIVSAAICLGYLMFSRDGKNDKVYFGMNLLTAIGLVLGVPHSWWARYAPCLYLVSFVAVVIVTKQQSRKKWLSKLYGIFILAVIINNIYFIRQPAAVIKMSGQFSEELSRLSGKEINLAGNIVFSGKLFDFEDAGVLCHFKDEIAEPEGTCYYEPWEYVKQD